MHTSTHKIHAQYPHKITQTHIKTHTKTLTHMHASY